MSNQEKGFPISHIVGFLLSITFTVVALLVALKTDLPKTTIMFVIGGLAVLQAGLQLIMFMHLNEGKDNYSKIIHTVYAIFMAVVIVIGSIWVVTAGHSIH
ncbi:cytochrome aa3 quinol oxidase subunit IV [Caldibacillus lycopersici]|uniref:Quinol oxidase subunit 4 n=1 Tax=Perspicuibacillus lycopersici TaxID=1325689 RepID=A0AAE3IV75_9BACI|nr:cytochrome aa3 quinol oxidase subunit IV [Perspicuibacillus lycopersici]MCU9615067.1 cytochrome aa3 quinol oxidase subunit IV [Perspicuibacillus lycopersici]